MFHSPIAYDVINYLIYGSAIVNVLGRLILYVVFNSYSVVKYLSVLLGYDNTNN